MVLEIPWRGVGPGFAPARGRAERRLSALGSLRITLYATPTASDSASGSAQGQGAAVDLGCLYELCDGRRGAIQRLGELYGAFDRPPFVRLGRDQRSWSAPGESLYVNLDRAAGLRRLLIFACASRGCLAMARIAADFSTGTVPPFRARPHRLTTNAHTCALAMITSVSVREVAVHREARSFRGYQTELDQAYRFGLRWAAPQTRDRGESALGARSRGPAFVPVADRSDQDRSRAAVSARSVSARSASAQSASARSASS